jgi:translocation and assembly module TamA
LRFACLIFGLYLTSLAQPVSAELSYVVLGVDDPLNENILGYVDTVQFGKQLRLKERDYDDVIAKSITNARRALRPFGYYSPEISGRITRQSNGDHVLELVVEKGSPIIVGEFSLEIKGEGAALSEIDDWRNQWPLNKGAVLDQTRWEQQKQTIIDAIESKGFLRASFEVHTLELDLDNDSTSLNLVLNTGPQFYMGDINFGEHVLKPGILEYAPRFKKGDRYTARRMDDFRSDLWKTGYFTDVEVEEIIRADAKPPTVDLRVKSETKTRNSYQGALGIGSDTGIRLQGTWSRHPISSNCDRIDLGIGWQELNDEYGIRTTYRKPRLRRAREYWTADLTIKFENQDLDFKLDDEDEDFTTVANGDVAEQNLRLGRLKIKNFKSGDQQLFTTPFVQYLHSDRNFSPVEATDTIAGQFADPEFAQQFIRVDNTLSIGIDADLVSIHGRGFETRGHRERAWAFVANESAGSDSTFTQVYLSSRRSYVVGNRWKFLLRAEVGYSDADVNGFSIDIDQGVLDLSVTRLPNFYRFKAGGSQSVRGYAFEQLSNNNIGSNNKITASAEVEMKFLENWSAAAFVDIGNAFNDWSSPELKTGIGFGIRWYSIAGPIRVDIAQAVDFNDRPWRIHFTIGTPLL